MGCFALGQEGGTIASSSAGLVHGLPRVGPVGTPYPGVTGAAGSKGAATVDIKQKVQETLELSHQTKLTFIDSLPPT